MPRRSSFARSLALGLFGAACLGIGVSAARAQTADLLLEHGRIWTANPSRPWVEALAIRGERILAVGSNSEIERLHGPRTQVIELGGRMAMPGVIDSHIHFLDGSLSLDQFALDDAGTLDEVKRRIRAFAAAHPDRPWLLGHGWYYPVFKPANLPTKEILDELVPDRPVVVECFDAHSVWVNSKALALAGITRQTPDPRQEGLVIGVIVRDPKTGEPTGVLKEGAADIMRRLVPQPTREGKLKALRAGLAEAGRHGVTSGLNATGSIEEMELYDELRQQGELTVRMHTAMMLEPKLTPATLERYEQARTRFHDDWVRAGVIKAFMDGVVEAHTAGMLEPYTDDPKVSGFLNYDPEQFRKLVVELDRRRFQVMTHAIGDRAIRVTLDAYEAAERSNGARDRRFRIEHIEIINPADISRFGRLGVIASMQPFHCYPDEDTISIWAGAIGPKRLPYAWAWRDLAAAGARLAFGSDWPIVSLDPFIGLQNAVTRQDNKGNPSGGWVGHQKVTLNQALAAYTRDAAYAEFEDNVKGSLEVGKLADVIVLSQNLFETPALDIHKTRVVATVVGGRIVYRSVL
jgi:predicted amidohydrolase YtcJ